MGYRSEVYLSFSEEGAELFQKTLDGFIEEHRKAALEVLGNAETDIIDGCRYYYWKCTKWQREIIFPAPGDPNRTMTIGYLGVSTIEDALDELPDFAYTFMRVGEEPGDIDNRGLFIDPRGAHTYCAQGIEFSK